MKTEFTTEDAADLVDMLGRRLNLRYISYQLRIPLRKIREVKEALRIK